MTYVTYMMLPSITKPNQCDGCPVTKEACSTKWSHVRGKLLYEEIRKNGTTSGWSNDDYKCFIDYYKAIDFAAYSRLQKKYQPKTAHNTFFLILYEIGMEDKDMRRIMCITQEAIRSTRHRIQQGGKK